MSANDPYDLNRFVSAQNDVYDTVLRELRNGRKQSHWIWYIFPQVEGLGKSTMSQIFAIKSKAEALAYLDHPVLGRRLEECAEILLELDGVSAKQIFGKVDSRKCRSSMTLFACISEEDSIFSQVLDKYFYEPWCQFTMNFLKQRLT